MKYRNFGITLMKFINLKLSLSQILRDGKFINDFKDLIAKARLAWDLQ